MKMSEAEARQYAAELEKRVFSQEFAKTLTVPVRIQMPGGAKLEAGGQLLVRALMNGGTPLAPESCPDFLPRKL